jgi:protein-S-isoprenylcysteine O-methyltransferase Ste14
MVAGVDVASLQRGTDLLVALAWCAFAAIFFLRRRGPGAAEQRRDPMGTVGLVLQGCGFGLTWSVRRTPVTPLLDAPFPVLVCLSVFTVILAFGSALLARWSVRALGKQWALAARLVEGHELVTSGPYRYVRNPIYSGMLGMLVATGLAVSRPLGLLLGALCFCLGTVVRVRAEERLLRGAFGQTWVDWSRRTAALIPHIW